MTPGREAATRRRLGRGLGSLISVPVPIELEPSTDVEVAPSDRNQAGANPPGSRQDLPKDVGRDAGGGAIPVDRIQPSPHQPRTQFDEASLESLALSIRAAGVMQPIVVRPSSVAGQYELIAGERRWRAAQRIGLAAIPAIVREVDDRTAAEWSLIENLQREDLDPIEQAEAFARLVREFGLTHQDLASRVGLDRATVSNLLRLNDLDAMTKDAVRRGQLSVGHAKVLLSISNSEDRRHLAELTIRSMLSVRQLEERAKAAQRHDGAGMAAPSQAKAPPHVQSLAKSVSRELGTRVQIHLGRRKGTGKLVIDFYSLDQFDGLMQRLGVNADAT